MQFDGSKVGNHINYYILSDRFVEKTVPGVPTVSEIQAYCELYGSAIERKEYLKRKVDKCLEFLTSNAKVKKIWIKQKVASNSIFLNK